MTTTTLPEVAKVQVTSDYAQFRYLKSNRPVSRKHVQSLIISFQDNPNLVSTRPILVNEHMEVIDGQHRLQACQALTWPIQYIVAPGLDIATAQLMNVLQKPWTAQDYIQSYAISGNENYQRFASYLEEYPIALTPMAVYLSGHNSKYLGRMIRGGDFKLDPDTARIERDLSRLGDFAPFVPEWTTYSFASAIWNLLQIEGYNHDRMMAQLEVRKVDRQPTRIMWLRELERTYNINKTATNQLRFF